MSEELIVKHCSPTLAGLKAGNLFNCKSESPKHINRLIKDFNKQFNALGIYFELLQLNPSKALIYVYRPKKLKEILSKAEVSEILSNNGYTSNDIDSCLNHLKNRLESQKSFPHEIGIFLDYPITDVKAFIENKGQNYKCVGCWKAYTCEFEAMKTFAKFKKCTDIYCKLHREGRSIKRLTVVA